MQLVRRHLAGDQVATLLLVGMWAYVVVPSILGKFTALADPVGALLLLTTAAVGAAVLLVRVDELAVNGFARLVAFAAPCGYLVLRNLYTDEVSLHGAAYLLVSLGIAAARPRLEVLRVLALLVPVTAVLAMLLGIVAPDVAIVRTASGDVFLREDQKALLPALGMLRGMFEAENNLGQFLALGFPLLILLRRRRARWAAMGLTVTAVLWSSSRTSLATIAAVLVLMAVLPRLEPRRVRPLAERASLALAAVVTPLLALVGLPDEAFTSRAGIWRGSLEQVHGSGALFGLGGDWYERMGASGVSPLIADATHGHNEYVHLLVTGGVVLVVLTLVQLCWVAWQSTRVHAPQDILATCLLVALLVNGWLELTVGYVDGVLLWPVTFPVLAVLMFARDAHLPPHQVLYNYRADVTRLSA